MSPFPKQNSLRDVRIGTGAPFSKEALRSNCGELLGESDSYELVDAGTLFADTSATAFLRETGNLNGEEAAWFMVLSSSVRPRSSPARSYGVPGRPGDDVPLRCTHLDCDGKPAYAFADFLGCAQHVAGLAADLPLREREHKRRNQDRGKDHYG